MANKKAASFEQVAAIHAKLAAYMEGLLDEAMAKPPAEASADSDEYAGMMGIPLDAATMGTIRGFLKDNDITCAPAEKDNLEDLRSKFSRASQKNRITASVEHIIAQAEDDDNELGM